MARSGTSSDNDIDGSTIVAISLKQDEKGPTISNQKEEFHLSALELVLIFVGYLIFKTTVQN